MNQGTLFKDDVARGEAARDRGVRAAARGAGGNWLAEARQAVIAVARKSQHFTTDTVWRSGLAKPANARALGAVMRALSDEGIIEPTDRFVPTSQATRHRAPVRVWRSLIENAAEREALR